MTVSVVALEPGFYTIYREKGDKFDIQSLADLGNWMSITDSSDSDGEPGYGVALIPNDMIIPAVPVKYEKMHTGGGNFVVVDFLGNQIGPVIPRNPSDATAANATAQGYVDQLNAGAAPDQVFP